MYTVTVHYNDAEALHLMHKDIRSKDFCIDSTYLTMDESINLRNAYLSEFMDMVTEIAPDFKKLPIEPYKEYKVVDRDYFCTEHANNYIVNVYRKTTKKGYLYNSISRELLFQVKILQIFDIFEECEAPEVRRHSFDDVLDEIRKRKCLINSDSESSDSSYYSAGM